MREEDDSNIRWGQADTEDEKSDDFKPEYPLYMPGMVKKYCDWFSTAYRWNPFAPVACGHCGQPVHLIEVYRCYDCKLPMHRECCIAHCKGARHGG